MTSWILDARRYLAKQQAKLADRQLELAPLYFLPAYENVFVPRDDIQSSILQWLRGQGTSGSHAALVLHGGYGAGKTRLAIESIRAMGETEALALYTGGISFLPLDAYFSWPAAATGAALLRAVAERLRAPNPVQKAISDVTAGLKALQRWLELSHPRLLLLDNGESVFNRETESVLIQLLQLSGGRLRCLITSRTAYPELRRLPVEAMILPVSAEDDFDSFAGSRVYLERVRLRDPAYQIPDPALLLTALQQTEGLPLNLELLAGRTWDQGARGLRALVEQNRPDQLLTVEHEPAYFDGEKWRHHSASTSILRSIDSLPEDEQRRFVSLAVFPYDWDAAAAEAICGVDERMLRRWRDSYLVAYNAAEDRWLMRPRIREVVQSLSDLTENLLIRLLHRDHYLAVAEDIARRLQTMGAKAAQDDFRRDHRNIETVFTFCQGQSDAQSGQVALRIAVAIKVYLTLQGYSLTAVQQIKTALEHPAAQATSDACVAALSEGLGLCATRVGSLELAAPFRDELQSCLKSYVGPLRPYADCSLAFYYVFIRDLDEARNYLASAESAGVAQNNPGLLNRVYNSRGLLEFATGNRQERIKWFLKSREQAELSGNISAFALAHSNLSQTAVDADMQVIAYDAMIRGLELAYAHDLTLNTSWFFNVSGNYFYQFGEKYLAARLWLMGEKYRNLLGCGPSPEILD